MLSWSGVWVPVWWVGDGVFHRLRWWQWMVRWWRPVGVVASCDVVGTWWLGEAVVELTVGARWW